MSSVHNPAFLNSRSLEDRFGLERVICMGWYLELILCVLCFASLDWEMFIGPGKLG